MAVSHNVRHHCFCQFGPNLLSATAVAFCSCTFRSRPVKQQEPSQKPGLATTPPEARGIDLSV